MPVPLASWSTLHMSKPPRHPLPKAKPPPIQTSPSSSMVSLDPFGASSSRTASLAGRKRPRESDENWKVRLARRTKSTGDAREGRSAKEREAFQRGLIAVFVPSALRESAQGNMTQYNDLLAHLLPTPTVPIPPLPPLLPLLRALTAHVSLLSPVLHSSLVSAIVALPWATGDEKFVKTFVGWAGVLVSAHPAWAKEIVGMAMKGLTWQPPFTEPTSSTHPLTRRIFYARHHLLLSHLISLIPTLPNILQPLLARQFPNKREAEVAQSTWVRNTCELVGYCPELGQRVWSEVIDRMLRIDVEITNILEEEEDGDSDEEDEGIAEGPYRSRATVTIDPFDMLVDQDIPRLTFLIKDEISANGTGAESDPDPDELSSVDGDATDNEAASGDETKQAAAKQKRREAVKSTREKLDGMLFYFFQHLGGYMGGKTAGLPAAELAAQNMTNSGTSTPSSEVTTPILSSLTSRRPPPTPAQSLAHFQTLLHLFSRQILPTSGTQHIPFVLFLCSSFSPAHTDLVLGLLVSQSLYATTTTSLTVSIQCISLSQRVAATVYIGSLVCRARFVTDDQARQVITYLLAYIDGKLHQTRAMKSTDELPLFYAVCQAVMLIFCFRWRAFRSEKEGDSVLGEMELDGEGEGDTGDSKWMRDLEVLQRAVTSELNPLLGCNPTIVSTFAKVAHQTNFAYCFSIIEANQQLSHLHTLTSSSHSLGNSVNSTPSRQNSQPSSPALTLPRQARQFNIDAGLDNYFPFDPYDLPRSKISIERIYRTWTEVAVDGGAESESGDEDSEEEDEEGSADADSELEDKLPNRHLGGGKIKIGSYSDPRPRLMGKDGGLSSSLEGMSLSSSLSGVMG